MKSIKFHAFGVKAFDRFHVNKIFSESEIIIPYQEKWLEEFPEVNNRTLKLELLNDFDFNVKRESTKEYFKNSSWSSLVRKKSIKNIMIYKPFKGMKKIADELNLNILANDYKYTSLYENKYKIRKKHNDVLTFPKFILDSFKNLNSRPNKSHKKWSKKLGIPYILQHEKLSGGKGTFKISSIDDLKCALKELSKYKDSKIVLSEFIKGKSASIQGCVTTMGVITSGIQTQIVGGNSLSLVESQFTGAQWCKDDYSEEIKKQAVSMAKELGKILKSNGYKGLFGIDFLLDESQNNLYFIETNVRITGVTPPLTIISKAEKKPSLLYMHIMEHLCEEYKIPNLNNDFSFDTDMSYLILHNILKDKVKIKTQVTPGLYQINKSNRLKFIKVTDDLEDIENEDQFLLLDIPNENKYIEGGKRLTRMIVNHSVLEGNTSNKLNEKANSKIDAVRNHMVVV